VGSDSGPLPAGLIVGKSQFALSRISTEGGIPLRTRIAIGLLAIVAAACLANLTFAKASAEDNFKEKCTMCHGPDGKGFAALKTPDFTDPKWQASVTDQHIADVIKNGKKDTAMKGFGDKLSPDEIKALVKYIRSLNSEKKK
jgi:mono/diheme cytochrome c family protein